MSEQPVDVVRRAVEAYLRRDVPAICALSHPECEHYTLTEGATEGEPFRGHAGIGEWMKHELDPWDEFELHPSDITKVGDRVVMRYRVKARGRGSTVELEADAGSVFEFRDGKILRQRSYLEWAEAVRVAERGE